MADFVLPDLRFMRDLGGFACLTSLTFSNWVDDNFLIPNLLAPLSPLRRQLCRLKYAYLPQSYSDSFALTFILDAMIHLPRHRFYVSPTIPLSDRFPTFDCVDYPYTDTDTEGDSDADEEKYPTSESAILAKARTDFETFASQWWEEGEEEEETIYLFGRDLLQPPLAYQSPFEHLSTLVITIHTTVHLVLLLDTGNLRNLTSLELCGSPLTISIHHMTLLRRTISR